MKKQYVGVVGASTIKRTVTIAGQRFTAILDTGATINIITAKAAKRVRTKRMHVDTIVSSLGAQIKINQSIKAKMQIGANTVTTEFNVVPHAPADILLGAPFLKEHSQAYNRLLEEFKENEEERQTRQQVSTAAAATAGEKEETLEGLLDKHPNLVLSHDQVPDPTRVYKGQCFELGLPRDKRDRQYYRAQYPPKPGEVEMYRKVLEPLIQAGVWRVSNSCHNNPVMLVLKKKPGDDRMVVDNRLVNAKCKPVGGMAAAPMDIIKVMSGAKIFTTLDCKNAFDSLVLAEKDRAFTAISPPGMPRLELTRMPMGAKASTAALY